MVIQTLTTKLIIRFSLQLLQIMVVGFLVLLLQVLASEHLLTIILYLIILLITQEVHAQLILLLLISVLQVALEQIPAAACLVPQIMLLLLIVVVGYLVLQVPMEFMVSMFGLRLDLVFTLVLPLLCFLLTLFLQLLPIILVSSVLPPTQEEYRVHQSQLNEAF